MKSILKTIDETRGLDYNEMFNSAENLKIRRKLVPELHSVFTSLMDRGKADENKHWVHSNNRVHDVKISKTDEEDSTKSIIAIYDYS
ncbi:hypothetical protein RhiirA1_481477 [Rhizophagus irregularis]|uniref:Uncharacterized protein n=1 Tax=Rhizophagus irregularis TaxID=588596 RepID=A0A2N0QN18_9GLOM|nr:hypothetical protein RhiirA1_481477 [Rhizophagus irregularis]